LPTVIGDKVVSDQEAVDSYRKTGQHLGIFDTEAHANAYAQSLHEQQARQYGPQGAAVPGAPPQWDRASNLGAIFPTKNDAYQRAIDASGGDDKLAKMSIDKLNQKFAVEDKAKKDAQEGAASGIASQIIKDPTKVTPEMIANNPYLSAAQMEGLAKYRNERLREISGATDHDVKTYGPGFYTAYQQVHAAQDDPNRITDPGQLYSRVGPNGDLTVAGVDKLSAEIQGRRTPEGAAEGQMKKSFMDAVHTVISQHLAGLSGGKDPVGETKFAQFTVLALSAYDKGRAAGKTPQQLLDEKSPDYIGKLIPQFVRSNAEKMRDMLAANNLDLDAATGKPAAAAPAAPRDLTTAAGITAAYKAGYYGVGPAAYDAALAELRAKGFAKPAAAQQGPPAFNPSSLVPMN
jgi:hypothetical protein